MAGSVEPKSSDAVHINELEFDDAFKDVIPKLGGAFKDSKSRLEIVESIKIKIKELNEKTNQFKDRYEKKVEEKNGNENIALNDLNELIRFKEEESALTLSVEHHQQQLHYLASIEYEEAKTCRDNQDDIDAKKQSLHIEYESLNDAADAATKAQEEVIELKLKKRDLSSIKSTSS